VSPEAKADTPKLSAFRQWLKASIEGKPEELPDMKPARHHRV
jgi:hypothetical protein